MPRSSDPATLQAVAENVGLSVATVSKILGGKYKGNTDKGRERLAQVAKEAKRLGYIANASARRLRGGAHHAVIVIIPVDRFGQPALATLEYVLGINEALRERGKSLLLHTYPLYVAYGAYPAADGRGKALPPDRQYDGALVLDHAADLDRMLKRSGVPVAFINLEPQGGRLTLTRDEQAAGADLATTLAGLGYRRILVVGENAGGHFSYIQRWAGITTAAQAAGVAVDAVAERCWTDEFMPTMRAARIGPGTVVVAMDVPTVLVLLRVLPPGTPLACCDDAHLFQSAYSGLTRVRFDRTAIGRRAAEVLMERIADPIAEVSLTAPRGEVLIGDSTPAFTG